VIPTRGKKKQGESYNQRCKGCGQTDYNKQTCQASRAALYNSDDI